MLSLLKPCHKHITMLDVQRKRLKHLMANAILELWKKETGSLSSVVIEGTICITTGTGHTIVVQVEDRFLGVIPDHEQSSRRYSAYDEIREPVIRKTSDTHFGQGGDKHGLDNMSSIDLSHGSTTATSVNYHADISATSQPSPDRETFMERRKQTPDSAVPYNGQSCDQEVFYPNPQNTKAPSDKSSDSDSDIEVDHTEEEDESCDPRPALPSPALPPSDSYSALPDDLSSSGYSSTLSRSFYGSLSRSHNGGQTDMRSSEESFKDRSTFTPLRRRSASPALMMDSPSMSTSTPKDVTKRPRMEELEKNPRTVQEDQRVRVKSEPSDMQVWRNRDEGPPRSKSGHILDLSHHPKDRDLDLSPPQNYTAQVRHVIRQRLLANRGSSSSAAEDETTTTTVPTTTDSTNTSTAVTVDTSSGTVPYLTNPNRSASSTGKESWSDKIPALPPSGPASWPAASQDKLLQLPSLPAESKFFLPGHFSPLLSVGIPGVPPLLPSSLNPGLFPSAFSPGFPHRGIPLPPGISFQDLANLSKQSLSSPQPILSQSSSNTSTISGSRESEDSRSFSTQLSGRSTPENIDINGNSEKDMATNGDQKVYICEYCNKHFLFKSKYHEHLPVHTNARPYQCHLCSRTYKYKYDLQVHLRTHMGIPTKSTICPFCSSKFTTNKMLRIHIVEAHQDRQKVSKEECTQPVDNLPPAL